MAAKLSSFGAAFKAAEHVANRKLTTAAEKKANKDFVKSGRYK